MDEIELPSPVVSVLPAGENREAGKRLPCPERWTRSVKGNSLEGKWVRQPMQGELPRFGEPLDEFYKNFFHKSFEELKQVLKGIK